MHAKPELFLHIGTPKTGTTALQSTLSQARQELIYHQIFYPGDTVAHHHIPFLLKEGKDQEAKKFFQQTLMDCENKEITKVVVSAEGFYRFQEKTLFGEELIAYIKDRVGLLKQCIADFPNKKIVVYLRRQDDFLQATYNQYAKNNNVSDLNVYLVNQLFETMGQYKILLDIWANAFGKENLIVRVYEKEQMPEGTVVDFLSAVLSLDHKTCYQMINQAGEIFSNPRLNRDVMEFKQILDRPGETNLDEQLEIQNVMRAVSLEMGNIERYSDFLSPKERRDIIKRHDEINSAVAREYLGRDDGRLFYAPLPKDEDYTPYPGLSVDKAVEIGWRMYRWQNVRKNQRIAHLENQLKELHDVTESRIRILEEASNMRMQESQRVFDARMLALEQSCTEKINAVVKHSAANYLPGLRFLKKLLNPFKNYNLMHAEKKILKSGLFDEQFYLDTYPDVAASGMDALRHYMLHGWCERRNPNPDFDAEYYLKTNPDVESRGLNPLLHYVQHGRVEGRKIREASVDTFRSISD